MPEKNYPVTGKYIDPLVDFAFKSYFDFHTFIQTNNYESIFRNGPVRLKFC